MSVEQSAAALDAAEAVAGAEPPLRDRNRLGGHRLSRLSRTVLTHPGTSVSVLVVALVSAWAVVPSAFTSHDPINGVPADKLLPPSRTHWFGTDYIGRDVYTRVVFGASTSLRAAVLAVAIGLVIGVIVGLYAGFRRGRVDDVLMRFVDVVLSIPSLLLSLVLITALGFGTVEIAIAVGFGSFASFARVMRAEVIRVSTSTYVEASRVLGGRNSWILFQHVLPNSVRSVLSLAALEFAYAILAVASLSFLGFGAAPPQPEWGSMVSEGRDYIASAGWMLTYPGLTVAVVVIAVNRIGRALRVHS